MDLIRETTTFERIFKMKHLNYTKLIVFIISISLVLAGIVGISVNAEETDPSLNIFSKNLSYGGTISIAFAVDAQNVNENDVELLIYTSEPTEDSVADHTVKTFEKDTVHEREALVFLTPGIAAKDMTKQIYVRAHAVVDGVDVYSETERYSVAEYAYDMQYRSKINENFIKLGEALLEVGEQIQTLLPHNEDSSPLDFFYVAAEGGTVDEKYSAGLFKKGETITLTYNGTVPEGKSAYWVCNDEKIDNGDTIKAKAHAVYEIAFEDSYDIYLPGAYYNDATKDGTRHDDTFTSIGAGKTLGIGNNLHGFFEPGTTYIVETDFTYNGGAYKSDYPAFFGLQATDTIDNKNMFLGTYICQFDENAGSVSIFDVEFAKGVTYNIRFEYTVGAGDYTTGIAYADHAEYLHGCLKFFVNGKEMSVPNDKNFLMIGEYLRNNANADRSFWGLGLKVRGSSYASSDFSVSFDNTFIAPKVTEQTEEPEEFKSYYENATSGTKYSFDTDGNLQGIAIYNTHTSNGGQYGSATVAGGALTVANNPAWYGIAFLNSDYNASTTYKAGTKYIFEADVTYNGGGGSWPAFVGFFGTENATLTDKQMISLSWASCESDLTVLDLFGAKLPKSETHKLTVIQTVGTTTSFDVYLDLEYVGSYSKDVSNKNSDANLYGFGFYFRGTSNTSDLSITFDNVYVGVESIADEEDTDEVTKNIESYYESTDILGARLDFSDADDLNGIFAEQTHTNNAGKYGSATIVDGALNISNNPAWYGLLFKNPSFDAAKTYANGTKYVFEADITYNGGASKSTSDTGAAFIGFITQDYGTDIRNGDMAAYAYAKYESSDNVLDFFGADFAKDQTHKLTVIYTVGEKSSIEVYVDLVKIANCTLSNTSGVADTTCAGFGFYFRGTGYTDNLDLTFDNVFVGVIEAE